MRPNSKQYKALYELSGLLNGYKLRNIDVLDNQDSDSNYTKFFRFLKSDAGDNETLAAQSIGYKDEDDLNYRRFRVDYRTKLLQTLFFIDASNPAFKEYSQALIRCTQQAAILDIVLKFGYHDTIALYGKELLEQTQKFELTEVSLKIATMLRHICVQKLKDKNEYLKYRELCEKLEVEYAAERKGLAYFDDLMSYYTKSIDIQPEVFDIADAYFRDLYPRLNENSSCIFIANTYAIKMIKYLSRMDYKSVIETCSTVIEKIRKKPYNADNFLILFLNNKITAHTNLGEYEAAQTTSQEVLNIVVEGNGSWFNSIEKTIRLAFHQGSYALALELFQKGRNHKNFDALTQSVKEDWYVIEAYIGFLEKIEALPKGSVNFKTKKFQNAVPMSNKDKSGRNIAIEIAIILHELIDGEKDVEEKVENLLRYYDRYMKEEQHIRSFLFICILKSILQKKNKLVAATVSLDDFVRRLLAEKYDFNNKAHYQEVIPFHILWVRHNWAIAA